MELNNALKGHLELYQGQARNVAQTRAAVAAHRNDRGFGKATGEFVQKEQERKEVQGHATHAVARILLGTARVQMRFRARAWGNSERTKYSGGLVGGSTEQSAPTGTSEGGWMWQGGLELDAPVDDLQLTPAVSGGPNIGSGPDPPG